MRRIGILAACAALTVCALPAQAASRTIDRHFHQRFEVEPGARLVLEHGDGDVEITPWDQNAIDVDVVYKGEIRRIGPGTETDFSVTFDQHGDTVKVEGHEPGGVVIGILSIRDLAYRYRIQAPPWVTLLLEGDDGDVTIRGWRAELSVHLDDGDIDLDDVEGDTTIRGQDGDVRVDRFAGRFDLETDDGDVTIRRAQSPSLRVEMEDGDLLIDDSGGRFTVDSDDGGIELRRVRAGRIAVTTNDGDVVLDVDGADGDLEIAAETDDGDVEIALAPGLGVRFDVRMDDGRVEIDLPDAQVDRDDHRVAGRVGDGAGNLRVTTADGDVTIRGR